jgi:hypothetical protein
MERQPVTVTHDAAIYEGMDYTKQAQAQLIREQTEAMLTQRISKDVAVELSRQQAIRDRMAHMPTIVRSANTSSVTSLDLLMDRPQVRALAKMLRDEVGRRNAQAGMTERQRRAAVKVRCVCVCSPPALLRALHGHRNIPW